jgi:DNA modification methylase
MQIELWPISKPQPYEKNPRKISDKAIAKVAASIKEFGFRQPIVVDVQGVIIAGHTRLQAAKSLGLKQVPVHIAEGLTLAQIKAYRLADNRTNEEAQWLDDVLADELKELDELGFALDLTGFDIPELNRLMIDEEEIDRAEQTPDVPVNPVTVLGDVWLLGRHRLVCGDSTNATDVEKCLNGVKPHLMVTDPPYGVEYDAEWRDSAFGGKEGGRATGKVANDDKADWREAWSLFPGDVAYVWHGERQLVSIADQLKSVGFALRNLIVWSKSALVVGRGNYHSQHETCWYAVREKKTGHWNGDRKQSTLWHIDKPQKSETGHSTQKPVECMRRPMVNNSSPGQAVYEPFSGSGTCLMAAEITERACHAIELNPAYVDVAIQRWQKFTGQEAILESTGKTYEEMKDVRYDADKNSKGSYEVAVEAIGEEHEGKEPGAKGKKQGRKAA